MFKWYAFRSDINLSICMYWQNPILIKIILENSYYDFSNYLVPQIIAMHGNILYALMVILLGYLIHIVDNWYLTW